MKRGLLIVAYLAVVPTAAILAHRYVPMETFVRNEHRLRETIQAQPVSAWCTGFVVYFLVSLLPGTSGKSIICGWLFGLWQAVLMVDVALTAAALVMFYISRYALRGSIESRFTTQLERVERHLDREGSFYLLTLRMAHAPYTVINYLSGVLPISTSTFAWTTQVGLLPGTMIFVFVGTRLPTLAELQERGAYSLLDPPLIGAMIATALFPVVVRWLLNRWPRGSELESEAGSAS